MHLIARHNRKQLLKALLWLVLSPIGFFLAWEFFRWIPGAVAGQWDREIPEAYALAFAVVMMLMVIFAAWKRHQTQREAFDLATAMLWQSDPVGGGGAMTRYRVNQIAGFAWFVIGIFLSGPLCLFRSISAFRGRLPHDDQLESRMGRLLDELRADDRWLDVGRFDGRFEELFALVRTGDVEFSSIKGRVKAAS